MIRFECGHCGKKLGVPDTEAGLIITCPGCKQKTRIPGERKAKPAPPGGAVAKRPAAKAPPKPAADEGLVEVTPIDDEPPPRPARGKRAAPEEEDDFEEDETPRKGRRKRRRRDEDDYDDLDDERKGMTANRIRGLVALVLAGVVLAFGIFLPDINPRAEPDLLEYTQYGTYGLSGLIFIAGAYYLIRG